MTSLDPDMITKLLAQETERKPRQAKDVTEPRVYGTWWKLRHTIREEGCENPDCVDTRPKGDVGSNVVALVKGKHMCRYCFLGGWLSGS